MLGKPEWFQRRKYGGWGIAPKTWQGWVYIFLVIVPLLLFMSLPFWSDKTRTIVLIVWAIAVGADTIDIMLRLKRDERERVHEALSERNALWVMVLILTVGLSFQIAEGAVRQTIEFDPFIAVALIGGLIVKSVTNIYLDRKD